MIEMKLKDKPFKMIKSGKKTIEMRLYDEKRRKIKVNDFIEFTCESNHEKLLTKVIKLHVFDSFDELYKHFDKVSLGYEKNEKCNPCDMEKYYSKEDQQKNKVVAIEIKLIKGDE